MSVYLKVNFAKCSKVTLALVGVLDTSTTATRQENYHLYHWVKPHFEVLDHEQLQVLHEFIDSNLHSVRFINSINDDSQEITGYLPLNLTVIG